VDPFVQVRDGALEVAFLEAGKPEGPLLPFLDRLCRLARKLEGRPRAAVAEALRRQERRVRDVRRLAGLNKALLDACSFRRQPWADRAPELREAVFRARGRHWPPIPGDEHRPFQDAAISFGLEAEEIRRLFYADRPDCYPLVRAARLDGAALLARYNLELARGLLLQAESMVLQARGGWKRVFRALKLARLMVQVEREGRRQYRIQISGPAAPWVSRPQRYGARFARALPTLLGAPGARVEARVHHRGQVLPYRLAATDHPHLRSGRGQRRRRGSRRPDSGARDAGPYDSDRYDSEWEADLADVLKEKIGEERKGWTLIREDAPIVLREGHVFLPDFTLRHADGREALVELVGFWTREYLEEKIRKVREAGRNNLVLVVSRQLGEAAESGLEGGGGPLVWFSRRPSAGPVLEAAERVARRPEGR
jgi:uncharacterized protein